MLAIQMVTRLKSEYVSVPHFVPLFYVMIVLLFLPLNCFCLFVYIFFIYNILSHFFLVLNEQLANFLCDCDRFEEDIFTFISILWQL